MDADIETMLNDFTLVKRLFASNESENVSLDKESYTQSVMSVLIQAGRVAKAAGYGKPWTDPLAKADPGLMLSEIENLLRDVKNLVLYIRPLVSDREKP